MPIEVSRWVFGEGWGALSWSSEIPEDGEALLQDWRKHDEDATDGTVYDLETLKWEEESSSHQGDAKGAEHGSASDYTPAENDDFVYFRADAWVMTPLPPPVAEASSPSPQEITVTAPMPFDPFGQQESSSSSEQKDGEVVQDSVEFFMTDPVVDPAGITIDRFLLNCDEENKDVEFYQNRAVKLYYQGTSHDRIPDCFLCPIGLSIMSDPVILPDGHSFDRIALIQWLAVNSTSPATRQVVSMDDVRPNRMLRNLIRQYRREEKELRQQRRQNNLAAVLERRRRSKIPVSFENDGISRLAI